MPSSARRTPGLSARGVTPAGGKASRPQIRAPPPAPAKAAQAKVGQVLPVRPVALGPTGRSLQAGADSRNATRPGREAWGLTLTAGSTPTAGELGRQLRLGTSVPAKEGQTAAPPARTRTGLGITRCPCAGTEALAADPWRPPRPPPCLLAALPRVGLTSDSSSGLTSAPPTTAGSRALDVTSADPPPEAIVCSCANKGPERTQSLEWTATREATPPAGPAPVCRLLRGL